MADSGPTTQRIDIQMDETGEAPPKDTGNRDALLGGIGLGVLLGLMACWYYYPYPSGEHPSFVDFLLFWGREGILVLVLLGAMAFVALVAVWRGIARAFSGSRQP